MKDLKTISTWDLQKELDRRNSIEFSETVEYIQESIANYKMGLIDGHETAIQIKSLVEQKIKEYQN